MHKPQYLAAVTLFQQLSTSEMAQLTATTTLRQVAKGHCFYMPGDPLETLSVIVEGHIVLYRLNVEGKKLVTMRLGAQATFGEDALLGGVANDFAEAADDVVIVTIHRRDLTPLIKRHPAIMLYLLHMTVNRLNHVEEQLEQIAFSNLRTRLANLLARLAKEQRSRTIIGYSHQDLADNLGTHRETATLLLNDLRAQGEITIGRREINLVGTLV